MKPTMTSHFSLPTFHRWTLAVPLLALFLISSSASALLMRPNGPEPIIIQIKESLRLSDDLDNRLSQLAAASNRNGLSVVKWHAGDKLLVMLSFPSNFTEQQALAVIAALKQLPAVQKIVAVSASNLEFKPADFAREYVSNRAMPEATRRGLDREESAHSRLTQAQVDAAVQAPHVPRQMVVRWKSRYVWRATAAGFLQTVAGFHAAAGASVLAARSSLETDLTQLIEFDDSDASLAAKMRRYLDCPWVLYAQPNYIYATASEAPNDSHYTGPYVQPNYSYPEGSQTPNDPYYTNPGQPNLVRIKAPEAWSIQTGHHDVVIAVADTGLNINHPDFVHRLSPGQRNFIAGPPNDVADLDFIHFRGSHVASIIGAEGNNGGVPGMNGYMTGVAWDVSLLMLRVADNVTIFPTSFRMADAIIYACGGVGHPPATAINIGWGFYSLTGGIDPTLWDAVEFARLKDMAVVAAAGDGNLNIDYPPLIAPASCPTDNVIAVAATRVRPGHPLDDQMLGFSDFGVYRVELGAPGGEVYTYDPDPLSDPGYIFGILGLIQDPFGSPPYNKLSGTSQAAAHVTGALALVKSQYPWENYLGIRDRVLMGTDDVPALHDFVRTGGRLNLEKALHKRTLIRNFSARAKVESGDRIIIGGFTISHTDSATGARIPGLALKVAIRGLGPSLSGLVGVPSLGNPQLVLNDSSGAQIAFNNDWQDDPAQAAELTALGLAPSNPLEAAMVRVLSPGSYTVFVQSHVAGQEGVGLFEIYELSDKSDNTSEQTRLRNVSARCPVGLGDEVAIAGTIVGDQNPDPDVPKRRLLMFGKGPSLALLGVPGVLADPEIELQKSSDPPVSNDQWRDIDGPSTGLEDKLTGTGLSPSIAPTNELESALWPTLAQGTYSVTLKGINKGTGIGLIEFFEY